MQKIFTAPRVFLVLIAVALLTSVVPATAVFTEVKVDLNGSVNRNGKTMPLEKAGRVFPGEVINWNIVVANHGNTSPSRIRAVGKIPAGTVFIPGSASGDNLTSIKFSIDDARTFSERPMITVTGADGVKREQPAPVESYTDILFIFANLNAREVKNARYQTRVR